MCDRMDIHLPAVITLPHGAFDPAARAAETQRATERLRVDGWLDHRDEVDDRLAIALRVLDQPHYLIDAICHVDARRDAVLAVAGRRAVKLVVTGDQVVVRRIQPSGLAAQAVALLPVLREGHGRSVSLPTDALLAAASTVDGDAAALGSALSHAGVSPAVAHLVASMNTDVVSTAQFGVAVAARDRRMVRGDHVIGWWANDTGGYLAEQHRSSSGESWTTIAPTDSARLARQLDTLLKTVHR
nr:ESX secretion-associated protein EspG [Kibdelosporangium phytohabitans]